MSAFLIIIALLIGVQAAHVSGQEETKETGLMSTSNNILGYVIGIAVLLIMAAIIAEWGM
jgi:biotin transporter BioY